MRTLNSKQLSRRLARKGKSKKLLSKLNSFVYNGLPQEVRKLQKSTFKTLLKNDVFQNNRKTASPVFDICNAKQQFQKIYFFLKYRTEHMHKTWSSPQIQVHSLF